MKLIATALALSLVVSVPAVAEERIAFANLDVLLALMAESTDVNKQLEAYHKELAAGLDTKQAYAQQKFVEAQEAAASGVVSDEKLQAFEKELRGLEIEIRESAAEADQKILLKRKELMAPMATQLETTIREVAQAEGYTYVLNSVDGAGTSIVLFGVEERNITAKVLAQLGISPSGSE